MDDAKRRIIYEALASFPTREPPEWNTLCGFVQEKYGILFKRVEQLLKELIRSGEVSYGSVSVPAERTVTGFRRLRQRPGLRLTEYGQAIEEDVLEQSAEGPDLAPSAPAAPHTKPTGTIDQRMRQMLLTDQARLWWTAKQWSEKLGCSRSAVTKTATWKMIMKRRNAEIMERQVVMSHRNLE